MTRPAVVRSLILGCAGELDAVTFAGVVATARIRPSVCQYSAIMSWARDNHGARIAVDLGHRPRLQDEHRRSAMCARLALFHHDLEIGVVLAAPRRFSFRDTDHGQNRAVTGV
jgi:hypothetical protein